MGIHSPELQIAINVVERRGFDSQKQKLHRGKFSLEQEIIAAALFFPLLAKHSEIIDAAGCGLTVLTALPTRIHLSARYDELAGANVAEISF